MREPEADDDEISLRPYIEATWRHRQPIGLALAAAAVLFVAITAAFYVVMPKERLATIQFRLLFAGAQDNKYPNGTPFNANEIVATPVLIDVYNANDLRRYGSFENFQRDAFVLQSNAALQSLDYDYQARLSDTRLSPVDRGRLEDEYQRKRAAIRIPEYELTLRRRERFAEMPSDLLSKVLTDTIDTWARQADTAKGAARPDVDIVSADAFARAETTSENFLVRVDVLRTGAQRIIAALMQLEQVPGARAVRTSDNRTLADELAIAEDILKFDIEPLMGLARISAGGSQDRLVLTAYVTNQLVKYRLDLAESTNRAQSLQTSLREYMAQRGGRVDTAPAGQLGAPGNAGTAVTQLSDSFIDRLMELSASTQLPEMEYRRDLTNKFIAAMDQSASAQREIGYYEDLLKQISAPSALNTAIGAELLATRFNRVFESLKASAGRVQKLYDAVSTQTMNPSRRLYQVTQPLNVRTVSALPWLRLAVLLATLLVLTLIGSVIGVLMRDAKRKHAVPVDSVAAMSSRARV